MKSTLPKADHPHRWRLETPHDGARMVGAECATCGAEREYRAAWPDDYDALKLGIHAKGKKSHA